MVGNWRTKPNEKLRPQLVGRSRMTGGYVDSADVLGRSKRKGKPTIVEPTRKRRRRH